MLIGLFFKSDHIVVSHNENYTVVFPGLYYVPPLNSFPHFPQIKKSENTENSGGFRFRVKFVSAKTRIKN